MKRINHLIFLMHKKITRPTLLVFGLLLLSFSAHAQCIVDYEIEKLSGGAFQVSMTSHVSYTGVNARVASIQITLRVKSGGFTVNNLTNLVEPGTSNEVRFTANSRFNNPVENPDYDYIAFSMENFYTDFITFQAGQKVPLFSFTNGGLCTEDTVSLITPTDPFYAPNSASWNANQQLTVAGYGIADAPICVVGNGVEDCTRECYLGCADSVQVSLGTGCMAEVIPEMLATAMHLTCPNGPKKVEILQDGNIIPTNPFVDQSHVGQSFQVRVIDSLTNNSCWGSIIVLDKTAPIINCEDDTLACGVQDISPDNPLFGYPTVMDNCPGTVALTYEDNVVRNPCVAGFSGIVERTWTAIDSGGMTGTCLQTLYFERESIDSVRFPPNRDGLEAPIVSCMDSATDPANTGAPTLDGEPLYPSFIGFCEINAGFRDDSAVFCRGNIQIIRTWTVVDACSGDFRTDIQIISVQDTTPPVVDCIDTIRATTNEGFCSGTVTFPPVTAMDACSGAKVRIETPWGTISGNGGTLTWVPQGYYDVIYVVADSCNNITRCTTVLNVADRTPPVAVCNTGNRAYIGIDGTVRVYANSFDRSSYDACSPVTLQVQRVGDTLDFADYVTFYCMDSGDTVSVNLKVTDADSNSSQCVATIAILDGSVPQIICPADQTVHCPVDISDLSVFGVPIVRDDCGAATYTETDSFAINNCGAGRIYRTFMTNDGTNMVACQQVITVENNSTFDGSTIIWPRDTFVQACSGASTHPDSLPFGVDRPRYDSIGNLCNRILWRYDDRIFDDVVDPTNCYAILRTWELIDWCQFTPGDSTQGYWRYIQQIKLVNSVPPQIDCPADTTINITDNTCMAYVPLAVSVSDDCSPTDQLTINYYIDLYSDGSRDSTGDTNDASGMYPTGTHSITFTASDDCGNANSCSFRFTVRDRTLPTSICNPDTFNIENNGGEFFVRIPPRQLALNSSDNCSPFGSLLITIPQDSFSCSQLGLNRVTVTITDEAGNSNTCTSDILITDDDGLCPGNRRVVNISGVVMNEAGEKVDQVEVSINHSKVAPTMTDQNGRFELLDVPAGNDYTILPKRDFDILNGISTFDLVLLNRHILGFQNITSPYKLIAADANRSGHISIYDVVVIRKLILRMEPAFPNNTSWRFVRRNFDFENPAKPLEGYFPEVYNINDLPGANMEIEGFTAIKIGDLNGSATTAQNFSEGESRNANGLLKLSMEERTLIAGNTIEIPINVTSFKGLLGYQFAMNFEPTTLEFLKIIPGEIQNLTEHNFGLNFLKRGIITTSWEQVKADANKEGKQVLFKLQFKVKKSAKLSGVFGLDSKFMKAEAYIENGSPLPDLMDVALLYEAKSTDYEGFKLYQNQPNPFSKNTIIGFELKRAGAAALSIFDVRGQRVKLVKNNFHQGYNELIISKKDLNGKGVYYYQLATSFGIKTRKMLVIE